VSIRIPTLRDRPEAVPILPAHFLAKFSARHGKPERKLSEAVVKRLREHRWKGNVRELEHVIENLVLFADGQEIGEEDLPRVLRDTPGTARAGDGKPFAKAVAEFERRLLEEAIAEEGGVKARAARRLGLDGNQIKYLCRKYGI